MTSDEGLLEIRSLMVAPHQDYVLHPPRLDLIAAGDGAIVVTDRFSTVYGAGDDLDDVIADYLASLFDTVADLEANEAILAPVLRRELAALRQHVARRE